MQMVSGTIPNAIPMQMLSGYTLPVHGTAAHRSLLPLLFP